MTMISSMVANVFAMYPPERRSILTHFGFPDELLFLLCVRNLTPADEPADSALRTPGVEDVRDVRDCGFSLPSEPPARVFFTFLEILSNES